MLDCISNSNWYSLLLTTMVSKLSVAGPPSTMRKIMNCFAKLIWHYGWLLDYKSLLENVNVHTGINYNHQHTCGFLDQKCDVTCLFLQAVPNERESPWL